MCEGDELPLGETHEAAAGSYRRQCRASLCLLVFDCFADSPNANYKE